jgi:repressor LexA
MRTPKDTLTARQRDVRDFIQAFNKAHGFSPTMREIGEHFKISRPAAWQHIQALECHGAIERVYEGTRLRALKVLPWRAP